jgi:concentrative nucleoside transporter, CNT family
VLGQFTGLLGVGAILGTAYAFSSDRSKISLKLVGSALAMQVALCLLILKTDTGYAVVSQIAFGVEALQKFAHAGSAFVFGNLVDPSGPWAFVFAFQIIPMIIFFSALMSLMYHLGIIQILVNGISKVIRPILGTSGAETLCAVSNSMLGQTEAPLLIKNYLPSMTRSQLLLVMISGMATLSGAILAVYGSLGVPIVHLLAAAVMSVPASIMMSKMLIPDTESGGQEVDKMAPKTTTNILDAIFVGTSDGFQLGMNVAAMLISFIALVAMVNFLVAKITFLVTGTAISFEDIIGYIFSWVALLLGIPGKESVAAGTIIGKKLIINEFVAYIDLVGSAFSERTTAILTYALAGFSAIPSIGIQIGGIGALAPTRVKDLTELGVKALLGGMLANLLSAAIVSLIL